MHRQVSIDIQKRNAASGKCSSPSNSGKLAGIFPPNDPHIDFILSLRVQHDVNCQGRGALRARKAVSGYISHDEERWKIGLAHHAILITSAPTGAGSIFGRMSSVPRPLLSVGACSFRSFRRRCQGSFGGCKSQKDARHHEYRYRRKDCKNSDGAAG